MSILYGDLETYSECDLKTHGTHRYAEHQSTEVMVWQWAIDDGEPVVEDLIGRRPPSEESLRWLNDPETVLIFHNSRFDRTILRHVWGIDVPVERWRDTMVKAMAHGLPGSLGKIGEVLGLPLDLAKDKRGTELVRMFCKPAPKGSKLRRKTRETHPTEWAEFLEYSRQDIVAMRAIDKRLPSWNYRAGHPELALWHLDQRINDRGFAVDVRLARAATQAAEREKDRLKAQVEDLTDGAVQSVSKRDQLLKFILEEYGVSLPDMRADTLRRRLEDPELPEAVKLLISIRLEATKTSTAKYKALTNAVSADGRLRNTMQFCGAQRTGRVAHRQFQPGNMPRPDMAHIAAWAGVKVKDLQHDQILAYISTGVNALKAGAADLVFDDVMQLTSNLVRGCIIAPKGRKICIADLANIEGRGLAWLAGEEWKLQAFKDYDAGTGADLYNLAYARSFNVKVEDMPKGGRQIGKVMELGLGYEGGVAAFLTFAAVYNMDLDELAKAVFDTAPANRLYDAGRVWDWACKKNRTLGLSREIYVACEVLKTMWRDAHPMTTALWADVGDTVRQAILNPGVRFTVRSLVIQRDGAWLRIRLPSGRVLCYLNPKLDGQQITYMGVNQYTRQWARIKTYGGKLVENCIARGTPVITERGPVNIQHVRRDDKVWDGVAFVQHGGTVHKGKQKVISNFSVMMTPDHLVLTTKGWVCASSCKGLDRADSRLPDGYALRRFERQEVVVGGPLRLRGSRNTPRVGADETKAPRGSGLVRVYAEGHDYGASDIARHVEAPSLRGVAVDVGPMPVADASGVAQLWRARHSGLRALVRIIRELLGRHGAGLPGGQHSGPQGQQRGVRQEQLQVGVLYATGEQHPEQQGLNNAERADDPIASGTSAWRWRHDPAVPAGQRLAAAGSADDTTKPDESEVYDLLDCGPRHRFTVLGADGGALIVHNCTQAFARDVLFANMPMIEDKGYEILLSVHDELLTETPDTEDYSHETLAGMMSHVPPWAEGLPLSAAGFETYRYRKD